MSSGHSATTAHGGLLLEGRARVLGDDINTDYIITSSRKRETLDHEVLRRYLLETVDPAFARSVRPTDFLVAGRNFGCGSAMEVCVTVPLAAGIRAVLARSFARTYFRNAVNNGLFPIECDTSGIAEGDRLHIEIASDHVAVRVQNTGREIAVAPIPPFVLGILAAGGLVKYFRSYGDFQT